MNRINIRYTNSLRWVKYIRNTGRSWWHVPSPCKRLDIVFRKVLERSDGETVSLLCEIASIGWEDNDNDAIIEWFDISSESWSWRCKSKLKWTAQGPQVRSEMRLEFS